MNPAPFGYRTEGVAYRKPQGELQALAEPGIIRRVGDRAHGTGGADARAGVLFSLRDFCLLAGAGAFAQVQPADSAIKNALFDIQRAEQQIGGLTPVAQRQYQASAA